MIVFVTPLVGSIFVFLLRQTAAKSHAQTFAAVALILASVLLLLAFLSGARAISIKGIEKPFLGALIKGTDGEFRRYNPSYHARGLLHCAAMNEAMNDHIGQLVKGAHVLTVLATLCFVVAAVPAAMEFAEHPSPTVQTKIAGPVNLMSGDLAAIRGELEKLRSDLAHALSENPLDSRLDTLAEKIGTLESAVISLQKVPPTAAPACEMKPHVTRRPVKKAVEPCR